ncbi:hypothetical protein SASPL_129945 [Salvia splendens]|uniref:Uncharacterized protein n=1 Tax=Salvia splendens TaxID=180675 RepID=A0A8X8X3C5_SALSN|nr:hypothetical protein SASPL_129945 [Salvia splendens]
MLNIFGLLKPNNTTVSIQERHATTPAPGLWQSRAIKIVHAGWHTERYYMATTAATIIQKNPSFLLARPEIFRRPWDSVVRPEEILVPGQKYYVVTGYHPSMGFLVKPGIKITAQNLHDRFTGIGSIDKQDSSGATSNPYGKNIGNKCSNGSKLKFGRKERARIQFAWEPALQSITE